MAIRLLNEMAPNVAVQEVTINSVIIVNFEPLNADYLPNASEI